MRRMSAGGWAMLLGTLVALALAVLLALQLLGLLSPVGGGPTGTRPVGASTLGGGVVSDGGGWSIRQADADEVPGVGGTSFPRLVAVDDHRLYLEAGGSGSSACESNFTGIELRDGELRLRHRVGDGAPEICTDDYRFTYFEIRADGDDDLGDVDRISVYDGDRRTVSYEPRDWGAAG